MEGLGMVRLSMLVAPWSLSVALSVRYWLNKDLQLTA
jgi:hypothetical protein